MARKPALADLRGRSLALGQDRGRGGVLACRPAEPLLEALGQPQQASGHAHPLILLHRIWKPAKQPAMPSRASSRSRGDRPARATLERMREVTRGSDSCTAWASAARPSDPGEVAGILAGRQCTADQHRFTPGAASTLRQAAPSPAASASKQSLTSGAHRRSRRICSLVSDVPMHATAASTPGRDHAHDVGVALADDEVLLPRGRGAGLGEPEQQGALTEIRPLGRVDVLRPLAGVEGAGRRTPGPVPGCRRSGT